MLEDGYGDGNCDTVNINVSFLVPFNTILVQYFGCRRISGIGFLLAIIGYVSSAFALELWHLVLGYSLLTGELITFLYSLDV